MQRAAIINQLSGLVVGALVDYWTVTIQKSAVDISKLELETNRQVRGIIAQNAAYGLSEAYDLNQYNALVAGSETKVAMAEQSYRDAVRKLLRTLNMPPETQVKGVTDLLDKLPPLDADAGVNAAFEKRVDYKNALIALENSKNDLKMQENNSMPSLTLSLGLNTAGQSEDVVPAFRDASIAKYPALSARMKLSYPLDDREQKTNLRNAYLKVRQSQLSLDNLKLEVRDDVRSRCEQAKLQYEILQKAHTVRAESELYHQKLFVKFRQGKVTSVTMKLGTDSMVQSRQRELESLVYYNVALLQYDLAKNEIFERYNVDVEKYIKAVKE
jgi:outer membrane protein TolC